MTLGVFAGLAAVAVTLLKMQVPAMKSRAERV